MLAINASVMRHANRTLLLNKIRMRPISRAELADEIGLTRASVTQIVDELMTEGLVIETSISERTRLGRRSTQLAINPQAGCVVGVELSASGCTVGVMDLLGKVLLRNFEMENGRKPGEVLDVVAGIIKSQLNQLRMPRVYGVGVSVPGPVDMKTGGVYDLAGLEEWNGVKIGNELRRRVGLDVYLENAANAQALEQKYFGNAGESFALVRMEDTLSVGVVVQDVLYRGAPDFAVELGQCPADPEGRQTLNMLLGDDGGKKWSQVLAQPQSPESGKLLQQLSYPLASVMCIYRVPRVVLGGSVSEKLHGYAPQLLENVRRLLPRPLDARAALDFADTDPVRKAASPAYHHLFAKLSLDQ